MSITLSTQLPRTTDTGTRKHLYSAVRIHRLLVWHTWKQPGRCYFLGTFYESVIIVSLTSFAADVILTMYASLPCVYICPILWISGWQRYSLKTWTWIIKWWWRRLLSMDTWLLIPAWLGLIYSGRNRMASDMFKFMVLFENCFLTHLVLEFVCKTLH